MFDFNLQIPVLFIVLCAILGTSIFVGVGHWCIRMVRGNYTGEPMFSIVLPWFLRAFIIVLSLPIFVKLYFISLPERDFSIRLELIFLTLVIFLYGLYQKFRAYLDLSEIFSGKTV